ncbi:response regulator transcription factor [Paenibacillus macquariensis]|uniref:DNA-binding response regulator, OmpR family, contains REC and winged-helix (WHTH) domain n=1 Tax=Paenibacillus macquariensis TaxID=948756 RepID=A0ABY1JRB2_9BACL|nr:response regulator transcription factor [Paenibacillus macquariensis]MEC0092727.1 response regulator transcription factor [Paenibacillus macquariensis]OAB36120.1 DNA-binding response regulator [Paenibacillus macquariensis subsp. macquariensis]SIQ64840.1 DNA-binding response regulator, OmpR family, contains REC and winged-helix (wHTH) domain [Paenibacillus macquariensis]
MSGTILLVEDEPSIGEMVVNYLEREGFSVVHAHDGEEALRKFTEGAFDLILLDLMIPKLSGMDFLRIIREKSLIPILIVSAKDGEVDKALGLGFGADDYIPKPFSMIELSARVKAALRRANYHMNVPVVPRTNIVEIHEIVLDMDNLTVSKNGQELKLTSKELQILKLLMTNPKKVFTKEHIYQSVWDEPYYGDENIINVHMRRLREKIEDIPSEPQYIKTLWGIGYRLGEF